MSVSVAVVLTRFVPDWSSLLARVTEPRQWIADAGADRVTLSLALLLLWLAACWLALGLCFAVVGLLPGRSGQRAAALAGQVMPRLLQRAVLSAAGASIVLSPVAAFAESTPSGPPPGPVIALVVPTDDGTTSATAVPAGSTVPRETTAGAATVPSVSMNASSPVRPTTAQPTGTKPAATQPSIGGRLQVRPGDSLWSLTWRQLGPQATDADVDAHWRQLYQANRGVIGADPNLIRPGQSLLVPPVGNGSSR